MMNAMGVLNLHGEGEERLAQTEETIILRKLLDGIKPLGK